MKNACFSYFAIQLAFLNFPYNVFERKKKLEGWDGPYCYSSTVSGSLPSEIC